MTTATTRRPAERRISPVFAGIVAVMAVSGWALWSGSVGDGATATGFTVFVFVTAAWIVSLCLHEYAHARTALHSGDTSIASKGYLTLNPLKYTHAMLSIVLPVIFVIAGGIGLPGGAVFIETHRIPGRWRHTLVSAAGPATNILFAAVCTAPFWLGVLDGTPVALRFALAFLALLQVCAAILNLLPVPGLDGYGIWEPWLSRNIRRQVEPLAPFGLLLVFALLWIPSVNTVFFDVVDAVLRALGVQDFDTYFGRELYQFWKGTPGGGLG